MSKILAVLNSGQRVEDIKKKYKFVIKNKNNQSSQIKKTTDRNKRNNRNKYR